MTKKHIDSSQAIKDIRKGMSNSAMMEKYRLSATGLRSLFHKMVDAGLISQSELAGRFEIDGSLSVDESPGKKGPVRLGDEEDWDSRTVNLEVYRCPKCEMPQFYQFDVCPQCGVIVKKYLEKQAKAGAADKQKAGRAVAGVIPGESKPDRKKGQATTVQASKEESHVSPETPAIEFPAPFAPGGEAQFDPEEFIDPGVPAEAAPSEDEVTVEIPKFGEAADTSPVKGYVDIDSRQAAETSEAPAGSTVMFRSDLQRTGVQRVEPVTAISELAWKFKTSGWVAASPVVVGGTVLFGSLDGSFYAVDVTSGEKKWSFNAGSSIYSSCSVVDGAALFGSLDGNLHVIGLDDGKERFGCKSSGSIYSSPAILRKIVYFGSVNGSFYAWNLHTGRLKWKIKTGGPIYSSPAIDGGAVFFGSLDGKLYALDASTGDEKWIFRAKAIISHAPAVRDETVYFGSADKKVYALDARTGREKWSFQAGDKISCAPAVAYGKIYFGCSDRALYAISANTGNLEWKIETDGAVHGAPTLAGEVAYFGSVDAAAYAADAHSGRVLWKYKTGKAVFSSPTLTDGMIFFGSDDGHMYALR